MRKHAFKRTAGQRRYLALKKKVDEARSELYYAQDHISTQVGKQYTVNTAYLMQKITEAREKLK